jgi:RsmE family RNA methyltransferase
MNIILLFENDFINTTQVEISDHRYKHVVSIHRAKLSDQLVVGKLNGLIGTGVITKIDDKGLRMDVVLNQSPPEPLPLNLILALPRPKMLKRIFQTCAAMGVKKIILMNSYRVEKSYWQSPLLATKAINEQLMIGLEQAKDTLLPEVIQAKRFKPFVEDELPAIAENTLFLTAHPKTPKPCPQNIKAQTTLVIGPEGGFIPYEVALLEQAGSQIVHLGDRILKVETAIPAILAKLFF